MRNPRPACPNMRCVNNRNPPRGFYIKRGYRRTKHDRQPVPRYQCRTCDTTFSATQGKPIRQQHRPELNRKIFALAVSGVSMRRMETLLGVSKRTVARKIEALAKQAEAQHRLFLEDPANRTAYVMLDDLETFIHSKYRQVSVPVIVRVKTGHILAFDVCRIPSSSVIGGAGVLPPPPGIQPFAWMVNERPGKVPSALVATKHLLKPGATIATDGESSYAKWIARSLPGVKHQVLHSPRNTSLGRAKRKASGEPREHDPLFAINVLFAKMRNDLPRLARKTWTTSKSLNGLRQHLWLYVAWTNGYRLR